MSISWNMKLDLSSPLSVGVSVMETQSANLSTSPIPHYFSGIESCEAYRFQHVLSIELLRLISRSSIAPFFT